MKNQLKFSILIVIAIVFFTLQACNRKIETVELKSEVLVLPTETYFYESENQIDSKWNEKATIGRVLFYDRNLSATNAVSCASCHFQENGFADGKKVSTGFTLKLTDRNSMGFSNLNRRQDLFWDARESNLNDMVLKPISNHVEMGLTDMNVLVNKLAQNPKYVELFDKAYGSIDQKNIADAIATFLLSIKSNRSKFDIGLKSLGVDFWALNNNKLPNLSDLENLGLNVFIRSNCSSCHDPSFSFQRSWENYANIGLETNYKDKGVDFTGRFSSFPTQDVEGFFRIPSLKNVALTAPYMHDGRFETLEQVVEHYNSGVVMHKNLSYQLINYRHEQGQFFPTGPRRLNLSKDDKIALVAFLKTLTDNEMIRDEKFSNPFKTVD